MAPDKVRSTAEAAPAAARPQQQLAAPPKQAAKAPAPKAEAPAAKAPAAAAPDPVASAGDRLDIEALADKVKARRREKGWTQADVAKNGGPSAGTISQIERCLSEEPAADTLAKLDAGLEWPENTADAILRGEMAGAH
ncbi:helix-turn-helix domain-containing protein [Nocardia sp. NPDC050712]|uniref:helix-turn-helix domain-containing protein n=1 Tax=Nocardia sp. NPDC050712 TaxID=3155518 RepID=UPI0033E536B5